MRVKIGIAVWVFMASLATAPAQERAAETVQVTLVEVPATVVGPDGEPLRGLTKANFEIYDRGRRREITHFDVIDFAERAGQPGGAASRLAAPARRNFMLLFDLANSSPSSLLRAREAAVEFTSGHLQRDDRVAVATVHPQRGFHLLAAFTTDRVLLRAAVETLGHPQFFNIRDPLLLTHNDLSMSKQPPSSSGVGFAAERNAELRESLEQFLGASETASRDVQRLQVSRQLAAMAELGRTLDRVAGRKHVILLSEGFDATVLRGRESISQESTLEERRALESGEVWKVDTDQTYGNTAASSDLRQMIDVLRRSDVVLHAIDIKGLRTDVDAREGVQHRSNEALFLLTHDTGGVVFQNANRLGAEFVRFLKSQEVTYILGFRADRSRPGEFHDLRVKLVGVPRGSRITHRPGYYEEAAQSSDLDRRLSAGEIIMNSLPANDLLVSALATPFMRDDGIADVPVIVEVDGAGILRNANAGSVAVELFMYAFDGDELIRDYVYQSVTLDIAQVRERLANAGLKLYHTLRLTPGDYSIRILAREGATRNGFAEIRLIIPEHGSRFTSAPLVFDDASRWALVRGANRAGVSPEYPFQVADKVFIPSSRPVLSTGKQHELAVFAFHAKGKIEVGGSLERSDVSKPVDVEVVRQVESKDGAQKLLLAVTPPKIAPGDYELELTLWEVESKTEQRTRLPVVIR